MPFVSTNMVASGTGFWTIGLPAGDGILVNDPDTNGEFPTIALSANLQSSAPQTITFTGDASSVAPNPTDSIGYTSGALISVTNDTGATLPGLLLTLSNDDPSLPLSLVPGVIEFGHTVNANYAYFADTQPVPGQTMTLFAPNGAATTPTGPAASTIALTGAIAPGATVNIATVIHNTELSTVFNNFSLFVAPA
jgi:hypothetical protein